jgi:ribose transport system substrate-binding protein
MLWARLVFIDIAFIPDRSENQVIGTAGILNMSLTTSRWLTMFLSAAVLVCLPLNHAQASPGKQSETVTVGFSQDNLANDWRLAQVEELQKRLSHDPNIRFIYTDARGSTAQQIQDIEDLIIRKVDILVASPRDSRAMVPVIEQARSKGIPVILLTRIIESDAFTTFIAPDDAAIARDAARYIASQLKGQGSVVMLQGIPTASTAITRTASFLNELRHYPNIRVVATKSANYLRSNAIKAVEELIQEGISFDAIYAQSDSMASGARIALMKADINPADILTVGIDYIQEAREAIRNGEQSASFTYPTCANEAVDTILDIVNGRPVPKTIHVPSQQVTRDNVEQVEPIF